MKCRVVRHVFTVLAVLWGMSAAAGIIVLEQGVDGFMGFEDTSIYEERGDNAGGALPGLFSGTTAQDDLRRALIRINLSTLDPATIIVSARLELVVTRSSGFTGAYDFTLHRLTADWGEGDVSDPDFSAGGTGGPAAEGDATWDANFHLISDWATPGGDFDAAPSGTGSAGLENTVATFSGPGMTADVSNWISGAADNHGWILISSIEGTLQRAKRFGSSEAESNRPRLVLLLDEGEDINEDSAIDAVDIQLVINAVLGLDIGGFDGDVNGDSSIDAVDIQLVIVSALS